MPLSTLDQLPTARRFKEISHPTFGLTFRIRSLTEREKTRYELLSLPSASVNKTVDQKQVCKVELLALCLVDADGNQVVTPDQKAGLYDVDGSVTSWIYGECRDHCWPDVPESVESAEKNSGNTGGFSSPSV
jgi:hypothetical protein